MRLLLFGGARAGDATSLGVTGLHMAAQEGNAAVADALLRAGASPDAHDAAGWTALHYAANHRWASWGAARPVDGQAATIALLAASRAQAGALDDEAASAMHAAAHSGRPELVAALRDAGVPVSGAPGSYVRAPITSVAYLLCYCLRCADWHMPRCMRAVADARGRHARARRGSVAAAAVGA